MLHHVTQLGKLKDPWQNYRRMSWVDIVHKTSRKVLNENRLKSFLNPDLQLYYIQALLIFLSILVSLDYRNVHLSIPMISPVIPHHLFVLFTYQSFIRGVFIEVGLSSYQVGRK